MIPVNILNTTVIVKRRTSTGTDSLGNPTYGTPTSGTGWNTVYNALKVRLAFNAKPVRFAPEGERILPTGVMYYNPGSDLQAEDRVLVPNGSKYIEYNIISVIPGYTFGKAIDHYEAVLQLP